MTTLNRYIVLCRIRVNYQLIIVNCHLNRGNVAVAYETYLVDSFYPVVHNPLLWGRGAKTITIVATTYCAFRTNVGERCAICAVLNGE